jgi:subtilisin family serine protease
MKYKLILLILITIIYTELPNAQVRKYWIQFKDKKNNTYSIDKPEEFLSQKAINRRVTNNIDITEEDLPVSEAYIKALESKGYRVTNKIKWFNGVIAETDNENVTSLKSLSFITEYECINISYNKQFQNQQHKLERVSSQKRSTYSYGESGNSIDMHQGSYLHLNGYTGEGVSIAILDAGFYRANILPAFTHLYKRGKIKGVKNFIDNKCVYDCHPHGMHVLSILGANIPNEIVGSAPDADYYLLRSENSNTESIVEEFYWTDAAEYADSIGVDIINSSLGYNYFDNTNKNHKYSDLNGKTTIVSKSASIAAKKGILVVVSAGNEGNTDWQYITAPADAINVLTVGSVDKRNTLTMFSSFGPTSDGRIKPDIVAQGLNLVVQNFDGKTSTISGTSFSAPIIAGLAACLWQSSPQLTNTELINHIKESGNIYPFTKNGYGYGTPNFQIAFEAINKVISDSENMINIKANPMPFNNNLSLEFEKDVIIESISILNSRGVEIYRKNYSATETKDINLSNLEHLANGVLIILIKTDRGYCTKKLIKT